MALHPTPAAGPQTMADTRMMGIVHQALRRDLDRLREALASTPPPAERQRKALAQHAGWMMDFLRHHHAGEDAGLFALVAAASPDASEILASMHADHLAIGPAIEEVRHAAAGYGTDGSAPARERLQSSVVVLQAGLLPHLRREEDELMPVVGATVTAAAWQAWDKEANLDSKSFLELGREGHWLIDGLPPEQQQVVTGLVPAVPRFILLHGFALPYRRHLRRCWGAAVAASRQVARNGHAEARTDAAPADVMRIVTDVTRVGEWSHECRSGRWLGGATEAVPGATFSGRNRAGAIRWGRRCEVVSVKATSFVWRTIPTWVYPESSEWAIKLASADGSTVIEQTYRVTKMPRLHDKVFATMLPRHRDRTLALTQDLERLGALAGQETAARKDCFNEPNVASTALGS